MPKLQTLAPDTPADEIIAVLNSDGALILRDVITSEQADRVRAELTPYVEATEPGRDGFSGHRTTRTGALVARSPATRDLIMDPRILGGCDKFLLGNCERYQLHLAQVIRIMPGQGAQPIHRDRWAWGPWLKGIEPQFNTIWALTDFTEANGATQVCPGSLTWPDNYQPKPEEIGYAEMSKGSVLIYSGTVFHGGGANISNGDRWGLNITYTLGWLRQEENQYLSCPPEIARTLDPALAKLIGYTMGQYALGYYSPPVPAGEGPEVVDPMHALGHGVGESMLGSTASLDSITNLIRGEQAAA